MSLTLELVLVTCFLSFLGLRYAQKNSKLPQSAKVEGLFLMLRSEKGIDFIERLADRFSRFWRAWGLLGVLTAGVGMLGMVYYLLIAAFRILQDPSQATIQNPKNFLVIPGVNSFLPLAAAPEIILGLVLGLIVHEGGHAIMCRIGNIDIDSTGLVFLGYLPMGAFVEPDEESQTKATPWAKARMFSAGVINNFALCFLCLLLLIGVFLPFITPAPGLGIGRVYENSHASEAGLTEGDRIVKVNEISVSSKEELHTAAGTTESPVEKVQLATGEQVQMKQSVFVTRKPTLLSLPTGVEISKVNGESVTTPDSFYSELSSAPSTTHVTIENGTQYTIPVGAYGTVTRDSSLAKSTALMTGDSIIITKVEGERVRNGTEVSKAIEQSKEAIEINYVSSSGRHSASIQADKLGVVVHSSISGITVQQFGFQPFPAQQYLDLFTENGLSILQTIALILVLPLAGFAGILPYNFPGFTPHIQQFYEVTLLPEPLDPVWMFMSSALFWTAWININLGLFNCTPLYLLDGGRILNVTVEKLLGERSERAVEVIQKTIKFTMLGALAVMVILPIII